MIKKKQENKNKNFSFADVPGNEDIQKVNWMSVVHGYQAAQTDYCTDGCL